MTSRIALAFVAAVLLSAGVARAATSSVSAAEEQTLETGGAPGSPAFCDVGSKDLTSALLQVPDQDRGSVLAARCSTPVAWPSAVDARDRR